MEIENKDFVYLDNDSEMVKFIYKDGFDRREWIIHKSKLRSLRMLLSEGIRNGFERFE